MAARAAYQREWYQRNKEHARAYNRARYRKRKEFLNQVKLDQGCALCGFDSNPCALDFHHRDPELKEFQIAQDNVLVGMERLLKEIAKCDVLCANCHRAKHCNTAFPE